MWVVLVGLTWGLLYVIWQLLMPHPLTQCAVGSLLFFYCVSNRSLVSEGLKVESLLMQGRIEDARHQLSMIVGRDTATLSPTKIRSAIAETLSENLSDGVVAPVFFFAIGGVPLMMAYKMINTLDSMVGYKNE